MTNGRDRMPRPCTARFACWPAASDLPRTLPDRAAANRRLLAAYLDRPLIPENFSADECLDPWSGRSLDDWWTFYEGGTRLVEYLNHAGYNGLMLAVLADGSTIYPSTLLEPTPRYDTGAFFATAQDPVRKDVLEMLLAAVRPRGAATDSRRVEFAAPLPELEAIRRAGGPDAEGIEWIGADGTALVAPRRRPSAAWRPTTTCSIRACSRRCSACCGNWPSATRSIRRSPAWPCGCRPTATRNCPVPTGDWTTRRSRRFERDAKLRVPGEGPQRFAERAAFLAQEPHRRAWLEWRAAQLSKFYRRAYDELAHHDGGAGLRAPVEWRRDRMVTTLAVDSVLDAVRCGASTWPRTRHGLLARPGRCRDGHEHGRTRRRPGRRSDDVQQGQWQRPGVRDVGDGAQSFTFGTGDPMNLNQFATALNGTVDDLATTAPTTSQLVHRLPAPDDYVSWTTRSTRPRLG